MHHLLIPLLLLIVSPVSAEMTASASWGYYRIGQIDPVISSDGNAWNMVTADIGREWAEPGLGLYLQAETLGSKAIVSELGSGALLLRRDARIRRSGVKLMVRKFIQNADSPVRLFLETGPALFRISSRDAIRETSVVGNRWGQTAALGLTVPDNKVTWVLRARYDRVGRIDGINTSGFGITAGLAVTR